MKDYIIRELRVILKDLFMEIEESTHLIGKSGIIDSLGLVELCLRLEDVCLKEGFEFDWTSDSAMSRNTSIFRTVGSLSEELERQKLSR
jgi:acyl carrier protein